MTQSTSTRLSNTAERLLSSCMAVKGTVTWSFMDRFTVDSQGCTGAASWNASLTVCSHSDKFLNSDSEHEVNASLQGAGVEEHEWWSQIWICLSCIRCARGYNVDEQRLRNKKCGNSPQTVSTCQCVFNIYECLVTRAGVVSVAVLIITYAYTQSPVWRLSDGSLNQYVLILYVNWLVYVSSFTPAL